MRVGVCLPFENYEDFERFEAVERGEEVGAPADDLKIWQEQQTLGDLVEPLGFDALWSFEHRCSPYVMAPNPQQLLAYFAGRTSRIHMGSMVTVLPWHNPVRLAENIALLQYQLGPQRSFILGVGRGLARREFNALGIEMSESRERFDEAMDILRLAFAQERFSYSGTHFKIHDATIRPRPLDPSVPFDACGVWTSEGSKENAARLGLNPLTTPTSSLDEFANEIKDYNDRRARYGHGPAKAPILTLFMYCCESEQEAREGVEQFFPEHVDGIIRHYEFGADYFSETKGYEAYRTGGNSGLYGSGGSDVSNIRERVTSIIFQDALYGTPEQCIEKCERIVSLVDPSQIVLLPAYGSMTGEQSERSLRLFAERALPGVRKLASAMQMVA